MESGSLLSTALQYGQAQRNHEQNHTLTTTSSSTSGTPTPITHGGTDELINQINTTIPGEQNNLLLSIYLIESSNQISTSNISKNDLSQKNINRIQLLQRLAHLHSIIHTKLLPSYQKHYCHTWFNGGQGLIFGLHCNSNNNNHNKTNANEANDFNYSNHFMDEQEDGITLDDHETIPHLRAMVPYGPHILDELYALAIMFQLSIDLHIQYNIQVAITCWDIPDGQILLLEGGGSGNNNSHHSHDDLPTWIDDDIGVNGMERRVYIVHGRVVLLPPTVTSKDAVLDSYKSLSREESLLALMQQTTVSASNTTTTTTTTTTTRAQQYMNSYRVLNQSIRQRLEPFRNVLETGQISNALKEYTHTSAVVLPLHLVLVVKSRPDLVPCAIRTFCTLALDKFDKTKTKKIIRNINRHDQSREQQQQKLQPSIEDLIIPFENLVVTTITLPKTLYAMLLTGAGKMPPPISIPKYYKSMEMKRMKRKCCPQDDHDEFFSHFRHSMEVGIRLTLGFEWILQKDEEGGEMSNTGDRIRVNTTTTTTSTTTSQKRKIVVIDEKEYTKKNEDTNTQQQPQQQQQQQQQTMEYSREERICNFHSRIDIEAGGDGEWIMNAWSIGPNETPSSESIDTLMNCPVWDPEVRLGGICPLSHPGKSIDDHVQTTLVQARKNDYSASEIANTFPLPRGQDVDSDTWIDLNSMDELEMKIQETMKKKHEPVTKPAMDENETSSSNGKDPNDISTEKDLDAMLDGIHSFLEDKSGIEGVEDTKRKGVITGKPEIHINPRVFVHILHKALKMNTNDSQNEEDKALDDDAELLQFFSKQDLDEGADELSDDEDEDENEMSRIMRAMDEDLNTQSVDRKAFVEASIPKELKDHNVDSDTIMDINLLSNLLQSVDAQDGESNGPVETLLTGLGVNTPVE